MIPLFNAEEANGLVLYHRLRSVPAWSCHSVTFTIIYVDMSIRVVYQLKNITVRNNS